MQLSRYSRAAAVTPSDTVELNPRCKRLYVGVAGDVKITTPEGDAVVLKALPVGFHDVSAKLIWSTGTAATNMVVFW